MAKKICLLSDLHLSINPRVWKEAFVYEAMGYEVVILTQWVSDYFLERDLALLKGHRITYKAYLDLRPGASAALKRNYFRFRRRLFCELKKRIGVSFSWAVSYGPDCLYRAAIRENADLYVAHVEVGFIVGRWLIQAGRSVGFDLEDWHSREYLSAERTVDLLNEAEGFALKEGAFFGTTSMAMASKLREVWHTNREIAVIYNSFPDSETTKAAESRKTVGNALQVLWTSRTIGPGRGLETLFRALALVRAPIELHLIGKMAEGYQEQLFALWPESSPHRLQITEFLPHAELAARIPMFDIGLAIENNYPDNKDLTISNKILQYMQAGIMVLCTDTQGQREVAAMAPESIFVVPVDDVHAWTQCLENAAQQRLVHTGESQKKVYREIFSWSVQEQKIRKRVQAILGDATQKNPKE